MEGQLKKVTLITYGIFYLLLIVLGLFETAATDQFSAFKMVGLLFNCLYVVGFFGYALNKKIWSAAAWRRLFYFLLFGTLVPLLMLTSLYREQYLMQIIEAMISMILSLPLMYCLYQYSKTDRSMWLSTEEKIKGNLISDLFIKKSTLFVEKANDAKKAVVTLSKESDTYVVKIIRVTDKNQEYITKSFINLGHLVTFMERYSMIRISDFEEKYS